MPLQEGTDRETISANIRQLIHEGYPQQQATAIAMDKAGKRRKKRKKLAKALTLIFKATSRKDRSTGDLFGAPTQISGYTDKHGVYHKPHTATRRKKVTRPQQGDLFGGPTAEDAARAKRQQAERKARSGKPKPAGQMALLFGQEGSKPAPEPESVQLPDRVRRHLDNLVEPIKRIEAGLEQGRNLDRMLGGERYTGEVSDKTKETLDNARAQVRQVLSTIPDEQNRAAALAYVESIMPAIGKPVMGEPDKTPEPEKTPDEPRRIDGWRVERGKGPLGRDKWVAVKIIDTGERIMSNLADTPEAAVAEGKQWEQSALGRADRTAEREKIERDLAKRLLDGETPTNADLKQLDRADIMHSMPDGRAQFSDLSPLVQRLFGIPKRSVRAAMGFKTPDGNPYKSAKHALLSAANWARDNGLTGAAKKPEVTKPVIDDKAGPEPEKPALDKTAKLRKVAASTREKAQATLDQDRNTNTARRARMASSIEGRARGELALAVTLDNLASAIEAGQAPALAKVNSRAAVETLSSLARQAQIRRDRVENLRNYDNYALISVEDVAYAKLPDVEWGEYDRDRLITALEKKGRQGALIKKITRSRGPDQEIVEGVVSALGKRGAAYHLGMHLDTIKTRDRLAKLGIASTEQLRTALEQFLVVQAGPAEEDPVKRAMRALVGQKVGIDFFPTPESMAERMARIAGIKPGMTVLEPSAGAGHLADAARAAGAEVDTVEISSSLRDVLKAKGHNLIEHDFMDLKPEAKYDAILMNPPFSKRQDADHVQRAWEHLKPGGTLVAITGEGVHFGQDQKAQAFRDWLDEHGADVEKLPPGTFQGAQQLAQTGTNARLITLVKPEAADAPREGDTKTENGVTYVLRDGRWHRDTPEDTKPVDEPTKQPTKPVDLQAAVDQAVLALDEPFTPASLAARADTDEQTALDWLYAHPTDYALIDPDRQLWRRMDDYLGGALEPRLGELRQHLDRDDLAPEDRARLTDQMERVITKMGHDNTLKGDQEQAYREWLAQDPDAVSELASLATREQAMADAPAHQQRIWQAQQRSLFHRKHAPRFEQQQVGGGDADNTDEQPLYGLVYRPAGAGAVPDGRYQVIDHPAFRHGAIRYDRALTEDEIKKFQLTPIGSITDHAQRLVAKMGRYAARYAEDDKALADFVDRHHGSGELWSTDNIDELTAAVKQHLAAGDGPREGDTKTENGVTYVLRNGRWHRQSPKGGGATGGDELDPNSPNYRYRDIGYVAGSRKELAAESIKTAARTGQRVRATDVDWEQIESNPREAAELITKSNLFGKVDWDTLREDGMEPGAGFLIDRIYASVATEPAGDSTPEKRKDYALALESLRDRLERCKTPKQALAVLKEIGDEMEGTLLSAGEDEGYKAALEKARELGRHIRALKDEREAVAKPLLDVNIRVSKADYERSKRERRGWKPKPELEQEYTEAKAEQEQAARRVQAWDDAHPELKEPPPIRTERGLRFIGSPLEEEWRKHHRQAEDILKRAQARNILSNPVTRGWMALGERFWSVINYRRHKGSDAFGKHVSAVRVGKVTDWSWADKGGAKPAPKATKGQIKFQMKVAEHFEREGGRAVHAASTEAFKNLFGLRAVQSGNWVLKDPDSAKWHVERCAEAFADLADLVGAKDEHLSLHGRLAMAFGARGKGNVGWAGAARAHYEPVERVINLTKMGGGGALAHEWFHALDNIMGEAVTGTPTGKDDFVTEHPELVPPGPLRDAVMDLRDALFRGEHRATEEIRYDPDKDVRTARYNVDARSSTMAGLIKRAKNAEVAVQAIDDHFLARTNAAAGSEKHLKKQTRNHQDWRKLAAAYHGGEKATYVQVKAGERMSAFRMEAVRLDNGAKGNYWSSAKEMAARAFQAWVEDRLAGQGRRNDYLSVFADNKHYVDPLFGQLRPFPEGSERERLNQAFDKVVAAMRKEDVLEKAMRLLAGNRAVVLFGKAGPIKNRSGLALQQTADKAGHTVKRWKRSGEKQKAERPPPQAEREPRGSKRGYGTHHIEPGDTVAFEADGKKLSGKVVSHGEKGATIEADGQKHKVTWDKLRKPAGGDGKEGPTHDEQGASGEARPATGETPERQGQPSRQDPATFSAGDYFEQHNDSKATPESILKNFPPDTKGKIDAAVKRLSSIEQTIDTYKQGGSYNAERTKLHEDIVNRYLSPERVEAATPAEGEKPTFTILGGRGGCLSADHEYLTRDGWKRMDQYVSGEEILVFDKASNETRFELPQNYINLPNTSFYHFKSRGIDMMLSEEHTILFNKKYNRDVWRTETAANVALAHADLAEGWDGMIPCAFPAPGNAAGLDLSDDELRLMVAVCADGSFALPTTTHCRMALRKPRKIERIRDLLDRCGVEYADVVYDGRPTEHRISFYAPQHNKSLAAYWGASPEQLKIIVDELLYWDGWLDKHGAMIFTTTQKDDADFVNYAFSAQGRRSSFYVDEREGTGWKPIWRVSGAVRGAFAGMRYGTKKAEIEVVPSADGRKYCFTTSTGFFITRRNDCICITGNSGKSWFEGNVFEPDKAIVLDADAIKGMLPEYEGWNAHQVHEESGDLFDRITAMARDAGLNIVHDATMKTTHKAVALVNHFKESGYRVEAHYMHLPRQEAAKRAVSRFLGKTQRFVPPEVVLSNVSNEKSFDAVKGLADKWSFRDNNVAKGSDPILISESSNGEDSENGEGTRSGQVRDGRGRPEPGNRGEGEDAAPLGKAHQVAQGQDAQRRRQHAHRPARFRPVGRTPVIFLKARNWKDRATGDLFPETVNVAGHTRKDGTTVKPHTMRVKKRRKPEPTAEEAAARQQRQREKAEQRNKDSTEKRRLNQAYQRARELVGSDDPTLRGLLGSKYSKTIGTITTPDDPKLSFRVALHHMPRTGRVSLSIKDKSAKKPDRLTTVGDDAKLSHGLGALLATLKDNVVLTLDRDKPSGTKVPALIAQPAKALRATDFTRGQPVRLNDSVRHSKFAGRAGTVKRIFKTRNEVVVEFPDGRTYDAAPENVTPTGESSRYSPATGPIKRAADDLNGMLREGDTRGAIAYLQALGFKNARDVATYAGFSMARSKNLKELLADIGPQMVKRAKQGAA